MTDFQTILRELQEAGWTQVRIAERAGCSQPTVSEIAAGKYGRRGPSFQVAAAIIDLHRRECGHAITEQASAA